LTMILGDGTTPTKGESEHLNTRMGSGLPYGLSIGGHWLDWEFGTL
jgi:hypothetical protein